MTHSLSYRKCLMWPYLLSSSPLESMSDLCPTSIFLIKLTDHSFVNTLLRIQVVSTTVSVREIHSSYSSISILEYTSVVLLMPFSLAWSSVYRKASHRLFKSLPTVYRLEHCWHRSAQSHHQSILKYIMVRIRYSDFQYSLNHSESIIYIIIRSSRYQRCSVW